MDAWTRLAGAWLVFMVLALGCGQMRPVSSTF